jgi:hypothetical protein
VPRTQGDARGAPVHEVSTRRPIGLRKTRRVTVRADLQGGLSGSSRTLIHRLSLRSHGGQESDHPDHYGARRTRACPGSFQGRALASGNPGDWLDDRLSEARHQIRGQEHPEQGDEPPQNSPRPMGGPKPLSGQQSQTGTRGRTSCGTTESGYWTSSTS